MIIYSCITNGHDIIGDDHYYDPDIRYVMFHDGTVLKNGSWEMIDLRDFYTNKCPVKMALYPKILPHKFFNMGENTVWVDACYNVTKEFCEKSKKYFPFSRLRHSAKHTFYDEMLEGFLCEFFSYEDVINATKYFYALEYNFKKYGSPLCAAIWRTLDDVVIKFNEDWWKYYKDTNIRDQISMDVSLQLNSIYPNIIEDRNSCGLLMGNSNKFNRRKLRIKHGNPGQQKDMKMLLNEMKQYVGMNTYLYAKANHEFMMSVNL